MILVVRPLFYFDVADEVGYLAEKAGPEIAGRWSGKRAGALSSQTWGDESDCP